MKNPGEHDVEYDFEAKMLYMVGLEIYEDQSMEEIRSL